MPRVFCFQHIGDIQGEIGQGGENNRWQPTEAAGRHRDDIQRVPEHPHPGRTTCGDSCPNGR